MHNINIPPLIYLLVIFLLGSKICPSACRHSIMQVRCLLQVSSISYLLPSYTCHPELTMPFPTLSLRKGYRSISFLHIVVYSSEVGYVVCWYACRAIAATISTRALSVITSSLSNFMVTFENFSGILKLPSQLDEINDEDGDD